MTHLLWPFPIKILIATKSGIGAVRGDVTLEMVKLICIPDEMIKAFRLPELTDLSQQFLHRMMLFDAGELEVQAAEAERQTMMINAQAMQDRGLHVTDMNRAIDNIKTKFVGRAERDTGPDAAAGEPHGKGLRMMIATQTAS